MLCAGLVLLAGCGSPSSPGGSPTPVEPSATGWYAYAPLPSTTVAGNGTVVTTPGAPGTQVSPPSAPAGAPSRHDTVGAAAMSPDEFWALVDGVAGPDPAAAARALTDQLRAMPVERIVAYEKQFVAQMARANTFVHRAAAETIMGYTSQDVFVNFRTWVLYQGRTVFEAFVADPDSLAGRGPVDDEQIAMTEPLEFAPTEVWQAKTGRDPYDEGSGAPDGSSVYAEPIGTPVDRSQLATRFPRLTAAYVGPAAPGVPAPVRTR
ncbi:hypothetical protein GCM10009740_21010 [Terrabacter terrae]|uniref:DUF4240 domain-containing protein n=1 Tax=Terrabacter terrae TaxID=318434 RepID=A0ABP5FP21_9MICO